MTLFGLASLPVLRATARERGPSFMPAALAVLLALSGALTAGGSQGAGDSVTNAFSSIFLVALTMALGAGLIADEIDSGHVQLVLLRPITRAEWYGGRFLGASLALTVAVAASWLAGALAVLLRHGRLDLSWALSLPLVVVQGVAWLSVLAALSVVLRRWMNVAALLLAFMVVGFGSLMLPLVLRRPELVQQCWAVVAYLHPQDATPILQAIRGHTRPDLSPFLFDLLWALGAWLVGVLLLNGREIAKRRA